MQSVTLVPRQSTIKYSSAGGRGRGGGGDDKKENEKKKKRPRQTWRQSTEAGVKVTGATSSKLEDLPEPTVLEECCRGLVFVRELLDLMMVMMMMMVMIMIMMMMIALKGAISVCCVGLVLVYCDEVK